MESSNYQRPATAVSKALATKPKVKRVDREHSIEKPRSLSRQKPVAQTKTRFEESKVLVATPRGSLLEQLPTNLSSLGSAKVFKLLNLRKEKFSEEAGSTRATANLASTPQTGNQIQLQFNIQTNGMASSAGFIGAGANTKKSAGTTKNKPKKEVLHTLGPLPTKTLGFSRNSKSRDREQLFSQVGVRSPVDLKGKYDLKTSMLNLGLTSGKKEQQPKKKDKNSSLMRPAEPPGMASMLAGVANLAKDKACKEISMKPRLKKKLTLDDDEFIPHGGQGWLETKHTLNSPKEESMNQNKQALDRIEKCLGDRQIKVSGTTAMKQSFKGGLTNEIKMQALRMARKGSKEFDTLNLQPGGYFEGLGDLEYAKSLPFSHRELNIRKHKDLTLETLGLVPPSTYADEIGPYRNLHIKTEVSISAEKKTSPYHSPTKIPKVVFGVPKKVKSKGESTNAKKSPKRRSGRSSKPTAIYSGFHSAMKSSQKEVNRSLERKEPRLTVDHSTLRTSAGIKAKHHKIPKVCTLIISNYGEAGIEGSTRGSNYSSTLVASKSVQDYATIRSRLTARTNSEHLRPQAAQLPQHLSSVGLEPSSVVPAAARLTSGLRQLNKRTSKAFLFKHDGVSVNQPKDLPETVYPSRTEHPDAKPLPFNLGDVRTVQQVPNVPKCLKPAEEVCRAKECRFVPSATIQQHKQGINRTKVPADPYNEELIENELNVPMDKPFPQEESTVSLLSHRGRVRPIIGCRPGSSIAITKTS